MTEPSPSSSPTASRQPPSRGRSSPSTPVDPTRAAIRVGIGMLVLITVLGASAFVLQNFEAIRRWLLLEFGFWGFIVIGTVAMAACIWSAYVRLSGPEKRLAGRMTLLFIVATLVWLIALVGAFIGFFQLPTITTYAIFALAGLALPILIQAILLCFGVVLF